METEALQQQVGELKEDLAKLRGDMGEILRTVIEVTKSGAGEAKQKLESKAREQIDHMAEALAATREHGKMACHHIGEQIEHHPMCSVLTALGVGYLAGALAHRK